MDGGGTSRPLDNPVRTAISHPAASATGSTAPSTGHAKPDRRLNAVCRPGGRLVILVMVAKEKP